jgi:hypothetical protein
MRVANFTEADIAQQAVVSFAARSAQELVAEIRRYADLPYVYVISEGQSALIDEVLGRLRQMRSPCYPYAVFVLGGTASFPADPDVEVILVAAADPSSLSAAIERYARAKLVFDKSRLSYRNEAPLPARVDVLIVGAGITGLYAANKLKEKGLSVCLAEKGDCVGGIWSQYANASSKVNTSEAAYRLREPAVRANRDHSGTAEILQDVHFLAERVSGQLLTQARVERIEKQDGAYRATISRNGQSAGLACRGVILAINDRVGTPRRVTWENQGQFRGKLVSGISDEAAGVDWQDRRVVIVGMGAFAVENARTALEAGARHVTVVCRRHGTVCPKIIDYLNFSSAYNERFEHDRKGNIRNMMLWKRLYDLSGATQPECWMGKIKHEGHTISVSDIWFIAHHLKRLDTIAGSVGGLFEDGVIVGERRVGADIVVNCIGFHRSSPEAAALCGSTEIYNNNYLDRNFMYLADAYIDDNAHNSFFGSSVLEMVKFYLEVYLEFFDNPAFDQMMQAEGIRRIAVEDRKWSHYIDGAAALIRAYPRFLELAKAQIQRRTANFLETHDLPTYIAENKREWQDTHRLLAGKKLAEEDCLPFVFEKLLEPKAP